MAQRARRSVIPSRFLFVISREQPQLFEYVRDAFSTEGDVDVVVDRRARQRRRPGTASDVERRCGERRQRTDVLDELRARGCAFVAADDRDRRSLLSV